MKTLFITILTSLQIICFAQQDELNYYGEKMYFGVEMYSLSGTDWKENRALLEIDLKNKKISFLAASVGSVTYSDVFFNTLPKPELFKNEFGDFSLYKINGQTQDKTDVEVHIMLPKADSENEIAFIVFVFPPLSLLFSGQPY